MKRRTQTLYQYEPLITPAGWNEEERHFAIRLGLILDTLYQRMGQMQSPDRTHPVGSICLCAAGADPARLFGGVWQSCGGEWPDGVCAWQRTA